MRKPKHDYPPVHHYELPTLGLNNRPLLLLRVLFTQNVDLNGAAKLLGISISTANQQIRAMREYYRNKLHLEDLPSLYEVFFRMIKDGHLDLNNPEHTASPLHSHSKQKQQNPEPVTTRTSPPVRVIRHRLYGA